MRSGLLALGLLAAAGLAACAPQAGGQVAPTPLAPVEAPTLIPPDSLEPAAGICGGVEGQDITVELFPDVPAPRCSRVQPGQRLTVVNRSPAAVRVTLGPLDANLAPGESVTFEPALGTLLAPGVHNVPVEGAPGFALWIGG